MKNGPGGVVTRHPAQEAWEVSARFFLSRGDPVFHRQSITRRLMKIEAISAIPRVSSGDSWHFHLRMPRSIHSALPLTILTRKTPIALGRDIG
jgi:hypothetical protein